MMSVAKDWRFGSYQSPTLLTAHNLQQNPTKVWRQAQPLVFGTLVAVVHYWTLFCVVVNLSHLKSSLLIMFSAVSQCKSGMFEGFNCFYWVKILNFPLVNTTHIAITNLRPQESIPMLKVLKESLVSMLMKRIVVSDCGNDGQLSDKSKTIGAESSALPRPGRPTLSLAHPPSYSLTHTRKFYNTSEKEDTRQVYQFH